MDTTHHGNRTHVPVRLRRRARQPVKRRRTVRFDLSDEEFTELRAAADHAGLARGAFAAQAALLIARSGTAPQTRRYGKPSASSSAPQAWSAASA